MKVTTNGEGGGVFQDEGDYSTRRELPNLLAFLPNKFLFMLTPARLPDYR